MEDFIDKFLKRDGLLDSYKLWEDSVISAAKLDKFSIGDEVFIMKAELPNLGVVREVLGSNVFGINEYYVEFSNAAGGRYCFEYELELWEPGKTSEPDCECGAVKVYGPSCARACHAFWCPIRAEV